MSLTIIKTPARFSVNSEWIETVPGTAVIFHAGQKLLYVPSDICPEFPAYIDDWAHIQPPDPMLSSHFPFGKPIPLHNAEELDESNTKDHPDMYYQLVALREHIYQNPETEWSIPQMTASLHISEGYFHSVYKYFHTTYMSDIIQSRVQAACDFLTSTNDSIEKIGEICGYHNTEHFIRQFKKQMGVTPAKYRKTVR